MAKKPLVSILAISGTMSLIMFSIIYCIFNIIITASLATSRETQPYFSYSAADIQFLDPLNSHQTALGPEMTQSPLFYNRASLPIDNYDGQELGRKIGDWVIKNIKNM
jgi:hypothetical protein